MSRYHAVFDGSGVEAIEPMDSYRAVLDAARSTARRHTSAIRVIEIATGRTQVIVNPDGSTRKA